MIQFELPTNRSSIIKVIGVGGGGGNAVNYMHSLGLEGVDFIICNTDMKALQQSNVPNKIQLGPSLTQGLGAGANPEVGQQACEESIEEVNALLRENTKMVFVTAGMGGGTGTGGAPIVSKIAKDMGILTVGIVTTPFSYEGRKRMKQAEEGIAKMREYVDTILVISNDKLRHQFGNLPFKQAFSKADDVLATATKCITDVINSKGHMIVDFADVCRVMRDGGVAILGSGDSSGDNRAQEAVEKALNSPLLNDNNIQGAKWVLLNINSAEGEYEHTLDEMDMIQAYVQSMAGEDCDVILGTGYDNNLKDNISVTIIATGFKPNGTDDAYDKDVLKEKDTRVFVSLNDDVKEATGNTTAQNEATNTPLAVEEQKIELSLEEQTSVDAVDEISTVVVEQQATQITNKIEMPAIPAIPAMQFRPVIKITDETTEKSDETVMKKEEGIIHLQQEASKQVIDINSDVPVASINNNTTDEQKIIIELDLETTDEVEANNQSTQQPVMHNEPQIQVKQTSTALPDDFVTVKGITLNRRVGNRYMTDFEIEDKVNFELQKKYFEERASKLRSMSNNVNTNTSSDEKETVAAYERKGVNINTPLDGNENTLSSYSVSQNSINSKNTFLDGNKPD